MRPTRAVGLVVALLLAATGGSAAAGVTSSSRAVGEDGIGDSYFPLDGNGGYDVRKYVIRDRLEIRSGRLTGNTTVLADAEVELTSFHLDLLLQVDKVVVNGQVVPWTKPHPHELRITPGDPLPAGQPFTVRVWYHGRPGSLTYATEDSWFAGDVDKDPAVDEVLAMNEPHIAPYWYPANDHPSDKARFDIRLSVPTGEQAISNGVLVSKVAGPNWTRWRWVPRDPMTTYLAFFAAGRFRLVHGRDAGTPYVLAVSRNLCRGAPAYACDPDVLEGRALAFLKRTPGIQRWMEERLGDYPFETSGGLVTALRTGFALENQTRPVYPYVGGPAAAPLVAHELAHQWFGDLVSVTRWDDIWINEGFAQYMEQLWVGNVPAWFENEYLNYGAQHEFWDLQISNPGSAIDQLFGNPVYVRGAMTLAALRWVIGSDDFWTLMHTWLADHAHGNASVEEFRALAEEVSGQELDAFFFEWLDDDDRPPSDPAYGVTF